MAMFEVGKMYEIAFGNSIRPNCIIKKFDEKNGLVKISQFGKIEIINVSSSEFHGAKPQE